MSTLCNNTAGSLKKMWPPVKKKAAEAHASFAIFIGAPNVNATPKSADANKPAAPAKAAGGRKRKGAADSDAEVDSDPKSASAEVKPNAAGGRKRAPAKKAKKEVKSEEGSADGGDGLGQYIRKEKIKNWLSEADDGLETIKETVKEV
jgi:hypothetical protein